VNHYRITIEPPIEPPSEPSSESRVNR